MVPKDYFAWIQNRFLIGNIVNPSLARIDFLMKKKSLGFCGRSYTICSKDCDNIGPIGGNFYGFWTNSCQ